MQKWEYTSTELFDEAQREGLSDIKDVLNKYGSEGWELVNVASTTLRMESQTGTRFFAFFKRRKLEEDQSTEKAHEVMPHGSFVR